MVLQERPMTVWVLSFKCQRFGTYLIVDILFQLFWNLTPLAI